MGRLRAMPAEAVREELVERNVAAIVRPPSISRAEVRPWSLDEAATFLAVASEHRLYALLASRSVCGKASLLALEWSDVDVTEGLVQVRRNVHRLPTVGLVFGPPESGRWWR